MSHVESAQKTSEAEVGLVLMPPLEHLDPAMSEAHSWIFQEWEPMVSSFAKASFE